MTLLKLSKTTYPQKLFQSDCLTLYDIYDIIVYNSIIRSEKIVRDNVNIAFRDENSIEDQIPTNIYEKQKCKNIKIALLSVFKLDRNQFD